MAVEKWAVVRDGTTVAVVLWDGVTPFDPGAGSTVVRLNVAPPPAPLVVTPAEAADADLRSKARQALQANATFLALATPTNAQNAAQLKLLTRQVNALIRLVVANDLLTDNTDT